MLPKVLLLDIETAPHTAYVWGLWKETVHISQLIDSGRILCLSYKWLGSRDRPEFIAEIPDKRKMLDLIHMLLDAADVVITYNGDKFDLPTMNKELLLNGYNPPSPYKSIDLYKVVRRRFRFASNKLDYVAGQLGLGKKTRHAGFQLWIDCMAGKDKAWKTMRRYNKRDVLLLERLYERIKGWIPNHPNMANLARVEDGKAHCPTCNSTKMQSRGRYFTQTMVYNRHQCRSCGAWSRSLKGEIGALRPVLVATPRG